jgi:hypothetical protein
MFFLYLIGNDTLCIASVHKQCGPFIIHLDRSRTVQQNRAALLQWTGFKLVCWAAGVTQIKNKADLPLPPCLFSLKHGRRLFEFLILALIIFNMWRCYRRVHLYTPPYLCPGQYEIVSKRKLIIAVWQINMPIFRFLCFDASHDVSKCVINLN